MLVTHKNPPGKAPASRKQLKEAPDCPHLPALHVCFHSAKGTII